MIDLFLIFLGISLGHYAEKNDLFLRERYYLHRQLQRMAGRPIESRDTVIVLIDDHTFWNEFEGRVPLRRDKLASLIQTVASNDAALVGVDVHLPADTQTSKASDGQELLVATSYAKETEQLLKAVNRSSYDCPVVLIESFRRAEPTEYHYDEHGAGHRPQYVRVADSYDNYALKPAVRLSYHFLYEDRRSVPPRIQLTDGTEVDSFSLAVARSFRPELVNRANWQHRRFCTFIKRVMENGNEISAAKILAGDQTALQKLRGRVVLIGGDWHEQGLGRGKKVDQHPTPLGNVPGVVLHANYVEAILDDRVFAILENRWVLAAVDATLGFSLVLVSLLYVSRWTRALLVAAIVLVPFFASVFLLQFFAIYCDVLIMAALLVGHIVLEHSFGSHGKGSHTHGAA